MQESLNGQSNMTELGSIYRATEVISEEQFKISPADDHKNPSLGVISYTKPVYSILVGNFMKVYPISLFGSLPQHNKFLVKGRQHDPTTGFTTEKLILKSSSTEAELPEWKVAMLS